MLLPLLSRGSCGKGGKGGISHTNVLLNWVHGDVGERGEADVVAYKMTRPRLVDVHLAALAQYLRVRMIAGFRF